MASTSDTPKMASVVASKLRRRIIRGEIAEGEMLPSESDMMKEFGVSRPTLREALRLLESESLISVRRGARGGAQARVPEVHVAARYMGDLLQARGVTLADVYNARTMIEPQAARILAERGTKRVVASLKKANDEERTANDRDDYAKAAASFHLRVVELAGNSTLELLVELLHELVERHVTLAVAARSERVDVHTGRGADTHLKLIELVEQGRGEEAETYWRDHLELGREDMLVGVGAKTVVDLLGRSFQR